MRKLWKMFQFNKINPRLPTRRAVIFAGMLEVRYSGESVVQILQD